MSDQQLIISLNQNLQLSLPDNTGLEELKQSVAEYINHLVETDFQKLVNLLYRIDINEAYLKKTLQENKDANAGLLIAGLIIERQLQKIKSRSEFKQQDNDIDEKEMW